MTYVELYKCCPNKLLFGKGITSLFGYNLNMTTILKAIFILI